MKKRHLIPLFLVAIASHKAACSPPRPQENAALPGSGGSFVPLSGAHSLPEVPELPQNMGGGGGGGGGEPLSTCPNTIGENLSFSKKNLLTSIAACTTQRLCEFEESAILLANRASEFADAPESNSRKKLREAFFHTMRLFARLELLQFGPQASLQKDPYAGSGIRDLIYSWPNVSRCRAEEQIFGKAYQTAGFENLVKVPINSRGLFAIEYLSFYEGTDNACTQFSVTNANDAWATTSSADLLALKHDYLRAVSNDVAARAMALSQTWSPEAGDFSKKLASASAYPDQLTALNMTAHALLYIEVEVKDYKLGAPTGLYENAPVDLPELSFSRGSTLLLQENLAGFRDLFAGCSGEGLGFDDWLIAAGHEDLSEDILSELTRAEKYVEDFPDLASATPEQLLQLHAVIKRLTDHLKSDLFGQGSPLGLTLPTSVEGDTD